MKKAIDIKTTKNQDRERISRLTLQTSITGILETKGASKISKINKLTQQESMKDKGCLKTKRKTRMIKHNPQT